MTLMQLDPKTLRCPDLTLDDYMGALARIKPSVNEDDVREHVKWTEEFGQDG
jgi:vacuolar protein-sorting-associated protein 4